MSPPPKYIVKITKGDIILLILSFCLDRGYARIADRNREMTVPQSV